MNSSDRNMNPRIFESPAQRKRMRGVTLIETITVLAVMSIVTVAGAPSLRGTLANSRATTTSNRLLTDLSLARSAAIMSGVRSEVCPSNDGIQCSDSTDWSSGWIVFVDRNDDDKRSDSEPLLATVSGSELGGLHVLTSVGRTKARFLPDGRSGGTNLSMRVCDGPKLTRSVIVNITGRARVEKLDTESSLCE